jgi:enamine deaminase RidA (YjgF/YER057c/UK114 family)
VRPIYRGFIKRMIDSNRRVAQVAPVSTIEIAKAGLHRRRPVSTVPTLNLVQGSGLMATTKGAAPLARYAPFRRASDLVIFAGIIAADPNRGIVIKGYGDLFPELRERPEETSKISVDSKDGPIVAQSWYILENLRKTVAAAGGTLSDVVELTQYFRDLRDFPAYNRIRTLFFSEPPASTFVRVLESLPTPDSLLEVEANR